MGTPTPHLSRWYAKDKESSRFDNIDSDRAFVGPKPRGRIQVDCHFMFGQSEWGTLTKDKHPGGIIYIDLDFHQPLDCRLKSATVRLTLDDEDPALANFASEKKTPGLHSPSVNILRHGPKQLCGPRSRAYKITRHSVLPQFEVGGIAGAGGVGRTSERHTTEESQWDFASHLTRSDHVRVKSSHRASWASNQLIWTLTENELAGRPIHNSTVHTGFSFAHGGQPFFMKVEVSGRLESRISNTYNSFRQAFGSSSRSETFATTLIDFGDITRFTRSLNRESDQLEWKMTKKNILSTLYEVPNTKPVAAREDQMNGGPTALDPELSFSTHPFENSFNGTLCDLAGENDEAALTPSGLEEHKRIFNFLTQQPQGSPNYWDTLTTRDPSLSSEEDGDLLRPPNASARGRSQVSEGSDQTLADEQQPSTVYPDEEDRRKAGEEGDGADTEAILQVLRLCGIWAVTQAILGLLAYCGVRVAAPRRNRPAIAPKGVSIDEEVMPERPTSARAGRRKMRTPMESG